MKANRIFFVAALTAAVLSTSAVVNAQYQQAPPPPPPPGAYQGGPGGGWDVPPPEFQEVQRQGFHDGVEGARKDFDNHRPPNVNNRDEFRHPHVDRSLRRAYRDGFRRGYEVAVSHIYNGPPRY